MPWLLVLLAAVYFAAGKLGLSFAALNSSASAVWPPTGIALSAFLLFGNRVWPAIFVAAFLVNETTAGGVASSLGIAAGNTLEGLAGAWLVARFAGGSACFEHARDVFKFAVAVALATTVSATIGVTTLALTGLAAWQAFAPIWITWWLGDLVGALVVTPFILLWRKAPLPAIYAGSRLEAILTQVAVLAVAAACFVSPQLRDYPLAFLCLAPLAWIAFRFGPREVATAIVLLTIVTVAATQAGIGPFVMSSRNDSLIVLQAFTGMLAITTLPMAALVREHRIAVEDAQAATRARDVFLAMLSHELRNPLQAIVTSLQVLSHSTKPEHASGAIEIAKRQSNQLTRLVNDLLDVARAVSGKMTVELHPVRMDEVVSRCAEIMRSSTRFGARTLAVEVEGVVVNADASRLEQIVANLLSNAVKFTSPNGSIRVGLRAEQGEAVLRVVDDGIGIPPELLPRVFDLFTQGERQPESGEGGLGIGLTLVRKLAELQGGSAEALSAGPGHGSEIVVRLPLGSHSREGGNPTGPA